MSQAAELIKKIDSSKRKLSLKMGRLELDVPLDLPDALVDLLRQHKPELLAYLQRESFDCWVLEEWRRCSIPQWREILAKSEMRGDKDRVDYARWMLGEVLKADER